MKEPMSQDSLAIGEISFFKSLSASDLMAVMQYTRVRHYEAEEMLFSQEDAPDGLYVITSGRVKTYFSAPRSTGSVLIRNAVAGDYLGEFGLIDGLPRSASAMAIEPTEVIFLPAKAFEVLILTRPSIALGVARRLVEMVKEQTGKAVSIAPLEQQLLAGSPMKDLSELKGLCGTLRERNLQHLMR